MNQVMCHTRVTDTKWYHLSATSSCMGSVAGSAAQLLELRLSLDVAFAALLASSVATTVFLSKEKASLRNPRTTSAFSDTARHFPPAVENSQRETLQIVSTRRIIPYLLCIIIIIVIIINEVSKWRGLQAYRGLARSTSLFPTHGITCTVHAARNSDSYALDDSRVSAFQGKQ